MKNLLLFLIFSISFTALLPISAYDCKARKRPKPCVSTPSPSPSPSTSTTACYDNGFVWVCPSPSVSESLEINPE